MALFRDREADLDERMVEVQEDQLSVQRQASLAEIEADRQRQAFDVGFPTPSQMKRRIPLIARVSLQEIPIYVRAKIQLGLIRAIKAGKTLDPEELAPLETLLELTVSVKGKGREEIVDISRVQPKPDRKGGWFRR